MIKCDYCNNDFEMNVKTKRNDDLEATYFICSHCKHGYVSMVTDAKLRKMLQRVKNLANKVKNNIGKPKYEKALKEYNLAREDATLYAQEATLKERV